MFTEKNKNIFIFLNVGSKYGRLFILDSEQSELKTH